MKGRQQRTIQLFVMMIDLLVVAAAWIMSYYIRFYTGIEAPLGIPPEILYFKLIPFIMGIWWLVFYFTGSFRRAAYSRRSSLFELFDILQACLLSTLCLIAFTFFYEEYRYSRLTLLVFAVLCPTAVWIGRRLFRRGLGYYRLRCPTRRILLIATIDRIDEALLNLQTESVEKIEVERILLIDAENESIPDSIAQEERSVPVDRLPVHWSQYLSKLDIQSITIHIPNRCYGFLDEHLQLLANQVPDIRIIPDIARYTKLQAGVDLIGNVPVIHLHDSPLTGFNIALKRAFDIVGSACAILVFLPVMALIAILVPISSPGPILYRQERMGLDGRRFNCLKFRSMPVDSERSTGAIWAKPGDGRATRFGSFLRRTSLDELPQLINVLRGDMSLVGPRPERPVFVEEFRHNVPGYMLRHKVKTGITGWAQVNGWRGSTSIHKRIECDLYYIQNWSLWLDIKILLLTVEEVFTGRNAY